ncbi:MAG: NUDIX hydrolase [Betaproteobacteria bacterium]|nr:NUDIX hydrolase [Betaproteobacteria bacterium]
MSRPWKPNVTVAAVVERDGRFLLVEEETDDGLRFNQPAGHLDEGESLVAACAREALEETAHHFRPTALVGIYQWPRPAGDITYLRFAFTGEITGFDPERKLDTGIVGARWLTLDEVRTSRERHRSPLILQCIEDYLAGKRYPLELITHYP